MLYFKLPTIASSEGKNHDYAFVNRFRRCKDTEIDGSQCSFFQLNYYDIFFKSIKRFSTVRTLILSSQLISIAFDMLLMAVNDCIVCLITLYLIMLYENKTAHQKFALFWFIKLSYVLGYSQLFNFIYRVFFNICTYLLLGFCQIFIFMFMINAMFSK